MLANRFMAASLPIARLLVYVALLGAVLDRVDSLYYDGSESYSIYPRLDLHLCANSSLSFDFTVSLSSSSSSKPSSVPLSSQNRLLIYAEQQIELDGHIKSTSRNLVNSYFLVRLVGGNRLVINDFWSSSSDIVVQLPGDYATAWFKFVYTRLASLVDISVFKYEVAADRSSTAAAVRLVPLFNKQLVHSNYMPHHLTNLFPSLETTVSSSAESFDDDDTRLVKVVQRPFSNLLVGGVGNKLEEPFDSLLPSSNHIFHYPQLLSLSKFHGYIMNLQYTSLSSQCSVEVCTKSSSTQRQYAIFSSSSSKQYKLDHQFLDRDLLMIDDICESDTLTHDICPRDCSCLSNNFVAPYFSCDCELNLLEHRLNQSSKPTQKSNNKCSMLFKSFVINLDDTNYFGKQSVNLDESFNHLGNKFDYPLLPSFAKASVELVQTSFDRLKGIEFSQVSSRVHMNPVGDLTDSDACFWSPGECLQGFTQHMIISFDRLDERRLNQKVVIFTNMAPASSNSDNQLDPTVKLVGYLHKGRIHFALFEEDQDQNMVVADVASSSSVSEWLVSSYPIKEMNRNLKITITWLRDRYFSLHIDGFMTDMATRSSNPPINSDIYASLISTSGVQHFYELGMRVVDKIVMPVYHQFSIKYIRRDYHNDPDSTSGSGISGSATGAQDSRIIVSSPLPSEVIRIDNTQRVMYKIDSPLTGVTTESIELSFRTSQPDGVIFYVRNTPIITYFELVRGQPVVTVDTGYRNIYLRPSVPASLSDQQWHEVKLHRDGDTISISIDSQYYDSSDLSGAINPSSGSRANTILTGGYVYLGLADPNNINLSDKKTFVGEMVRGKVTINNIQQKVVQQPYYWPQTPGGGATGASGYPAAPSYTTNQTVSIDASQLGTSPDGKMINIVINVYGPPGFTAGLNGAGSQSTVISANNQNQGSSEADTHLIYLDNLPDTRYISVASSDREIDFRVPGGASGRSLDSFLIKFQTRQHCGQLVTLVNDRRNFIGLELNNGYLYSSSSTTGTPQRYQISRFRVDDGRIYQVNLKQDGQKLLCWLDMDDSYRQPIMYSSPIVINTIRVAGQDGASYGFTSPNPFVGCIGSIIFNDRDVIDYKYVPSERRQSCQNVVHPPVISPEEQTVKPSPPPPPPSPQTPSTPVSLGYINFNKPSDLLVFNYMYDHEKPYFEDISFIFRTTSPSGVLFSAHNNDNGAEPHLIGAYLKDGLVHVVYLNSSFTQELHFSNNPVDDGSLYRLNIRRNSNGHGFIQLQSYVGVTALDFYTQPGPIQFGKIVVGGADEWSRIRYYGTRPDFNGCIIDLFQVNGNSVIRPADIPKERYNCNVEGPKRPHPTRQPPPATVPTNRPSCIPNDYPIRFDTSSDVLSYQPYSGPESSRLCEHIHIPFRTRIGRGVIYSHYSDDGSSYILVYLNRGYVNVIARAGHGNEEKEIKLQAARVDDGVLHKIDIHCEPSNYLIAYLDQNRQAEANHVMLDSPMFLSGYTIGYYNPERMALSRRHAASLDYFNGCIEQIQFNKECIIFESMFASSDYRQRLTCPVQPSHQVQPSQPSTSPNGQSCSTWRFRGSNSGQLEFTPTQLPSPTSQQELTFEFNSTSGTVMCSRDDHLALKVELKDYRVLLSLFDARSRRFIKAATCHQQRNGDNWKKVHLVKKNRGYITISCDDGPTQSLQHDLGVDLPFVNNNKHGLTFGADCLDERSNGRKLTGEINQIVYVQDGQSYSFDDLQYAEDPRLVYKNYVEFRPKQASEVADPKPIHFRSVKSSARLDRWDSSRQGRVAFEFRLDSQSPHRGVIFSTDSVGSSFVFYVLDGYLEVLLSPHRVSGYSDSVNSYQNNNNYDRYQRLFANKVNDGQWHKLEFFMAGDSMLATFVLDDDTHARVKLPMNYWTEDSALVFGNNVDSKSNTDNNGDSFRGCLRNVVVNNRPINWMSIGQLFNIEAGCYGTPIISDENGQDNSKSAITLIDQGCLRYVSTARGGDREALELAFHTDGGDLQTLFDSSDFIIFTQGPSLVIRAKDDESNLAVVAPERGVAFNDGSLHRLRIERQSDSSIHVNVDSRYKTEFQNSRRANRLSPFYIGCNKGRNTPKYNHFDGSIQDLVYSSDQSRVDLIQNLNDGDQSVQVDGVVAWTNPGRRTQPTSSPSDAVSLLKDNSFVRVERLNFDSNSQVTFAFRTNEKNGLLALLSPTSNGQTSFVAVELANGSVSLLVNAERQLKRVTCHSEDKFNDNKWHSIGIKRDKLSMDSSAASLTLTCDSHKVRFKLPGDLRLASNVQLIVGNVTSADKNQNLGSLNELWQQGSRSTKYLGCIGDFRVNDKAYNLYQSSVSDSKATLEKGCSASADGACSSSRASPSSRCMNQGECVDGFGGRTSCSCSHTSFTGDKCQQPAQTLSFNGTHYLEYGLNKEQSSYSEDLSLRFRTRLRNGVLFALKKSPDQPSLIVTLEDGRIKCVYDRDNKNDRVIYVGEPGQFNTNKWHTLYLRRYGSDVYLEVLDSQKVKLGTVDDLGDQFTHNVPYRLITVGSLRSGSSPQHLAEYPNFIGWIQNVRFNRDELLPNRGPKSSQASGHAEIGESSMLLHHAITFSSACRFTLPNSGSPSSLNGDSFNIHLFIKTSNENGVVLFRRGKDSRFMILEVRQGRLRFSFNTGAGLKELVVTDTYVNDNNWHEITVRRVDRQRVGLKCDDFSENQIDIGHQPNQQTNLFADLEAYNVGGVPVDYQRMDGHSSNQQSGFVGCLASLEINQESVNLYSPSILNTCPSNIQRGCMGLTCAPDTCSNNGVCSINSGKVQCNCEMTSFTGSSCKDNSNYFFFGKDKHGCGLVKYELGTSGSGLRDQQQDRLAFGFTTTNQNAMLTRIVGDDSRQYIEIRLKDGFIQCAVNLNNNEEVFTYSTEKKLNDNTYHVIQFYRDRGEISVRVDNFDTYKFRLKARGSDCCVFRHEQFVLVGTIDESVHVKRDECYYGIISGMFFNGYSVLDKGSRLGDVGIVDYKYVVIDIDINRNRTKPMMPGTPHCPLGYIESVSVCVFSMCPLNADQIGDLCSCFQGYVEVEMHCVRRNDTVPSGLLGTSNKYIPARTRRPEAPIGLILGIISGIMLALLAAALAARKCSDGFCIAAGRPPVKPVVTTVSTYTSTTQTNEMSEINIREQEPLMYGVRKEEYCHKDTLDMGYYQQPAPLPVYTQSVNETMEMYETTVGGGCGGTNVTTYNTIAGANVAAGSSHHHHHHHRNLEMNNMFMESSTGADYELSKVTCLTMTPEGKYAIVGQSMGPPQIWDTLSGQLVRTMCGTCFNCSNLTLACQGRYLIGLSSDSESTMSTTTAGLGATPSVSPHIQSLQIWDVSTDQPVQFSHQIKCCVFALSNDTNSIVMAGNQRFGQGISVGIFDLITFELTKEIKSDPNLVLGDPESIVITPDERFVVVGCRYGPPGGTGCATTTNFVVFDLTKAAEIAQTKSIAFNAEPKCIQALSNSEMLTGSLGGNLLQWNIHTCQVTHEYCDDDVTAHEAPISQICLSPSKEFVVTGSYDCTAKVWNTNSKCLVSILSGHRAEVTCVSISNNELVVTGSSDQTVGLWRLHGGQQVSSILVGMNLVEVSIAKHNKRIVAIGERDGDQQLLMLKVVDVQR